VSRQNYTKWYGENVIGFLWVGLLGCRLNKDGAINLKLGGTGNNVIGLLLVVMVNNNLTERRAIHGKEL
jgi:hypothetical protein